MIIVFHSCMHPLFFGKSRRCSGARVMRFSLHPSGKPNSSVYIVACRLKADYESTRTSTATQRLQLELVSVTAEMNTLTTATSETRV
jgi:hypothetical protein